MKRAILTLALLLIFSSITVGVHADSSQTYTFTEPEQSWFAGAVQLGNHTYVAGSTEIYDYANGNFTPVFQTASGWLITDIVAYGSELAVAEIEYQVNSSSGTGGGGGAVIEAESTPLQPAGVNDTEMYDILKAEVLILNSQFTIVNTATFEQVICVSGVSGLYHSFHISAQNSKIYGYTSGYRRDNGTAFSEILDFSDGTYKEFFYGKNIQFITAGAQYIYVGVANYVNVYDSSWNLVKQESEIGGYSSYVQAMATGENETWSVGYGVGSSGEKGAMVSVDSPDFSTSDMFAFVANRSTYTGVAVNGSLGYVVSEDSHVYVYSDNSTNPVSTFSSNFQYIKSMTDGQYYTLTSTAKVHAMRIALFEEGVIFGGYVIGENEKSCMFVTVHYFDPSETPSNWQDAGAGVFLPSNVGQIWDKYKYEILAAGAVFLLIFLSGGGKREE